MPNAIPGAAIPEKNATSTTAAWLVFLEVTDGSEEVLRCVRNTEDLTWRGEAWKWFPFEFDPLQITASGEVPQAILRVDNTTRAVEQYLERCNGGVAATATFHVVNSNLLHLDDPMASFTFRVTGCKAKSDWVYWTLGADNPFRRPFGRRMYSSTCRYRLITECPKVGVCNHTLKRCRELALVEIYGGFAPMAAKGLTLV